MSLYGKVESDFKLDIDLCVPKYLALVLCGLAFFNTLIVVGYPLPLLEGYYDRILTLMHLLLITFFCIRRSNNTIYILIFECVVNMLSLLVWDKGINFWVFSYLFTMKLMPIFYIEYYIDSLAGLFVQFYLWIEVMMKLVLLFYALHLKNIYLNKSEIA